MVGNGTFTVRRSVGVVMVVVPGPVLLADAAVVGGGDNGGGGSGNDMLFVHSQLSICAFSLYLGLVTC